MDISESDRDKLRESQRALHNDPERPVGFIIEHKSINPRTYKNLPNKTNHPGEPTTSTSQANDVMYEPKFQPDDEVKNSPEVEEFNPLNDLEEYRSNTWLNMDKIEPEKLEWMNDKFEKNCDNSTRFNDQGKVSLSGDEEAHDLDSLTNLLDSAYTPQVNYALVTISKIADLINRGYYDFAFTESIHELLIDQCLLKVRKHMDSTSETTYRSALKCFHSLLSNTMIDEFILDRVHPLITRDIEPTVWLYDDDNPKILDVDMKDNDCLKIDVVRTLLERTRVIERFAWFLGQKLDNRSCECVLDTLIRLSRHSIGACLFMNRRDLLSKVVNLFIPGTIEIQKADMWPLAVKALKFIRILAQGAYEAGDDPNSSKFQSQLPMNIVDNIQAYFFIDCLDSFESSGTGIIYAIHIETLRLMKALYKLKRFKQSIYELLKVGQERFYTGLRYIACMKPSEEVNSRVSSRWQYAAHLIDTIGFFAKFDYTSDHPIILGYSNMWLTMAVPIILGWISEVVRMKIIPHVDISIAITTGSYHIKNIPDIGTHHNMIDAAIKPIIEADKRQERLNFIKLLIRTAGERSQLKDFMEKNGVMRDPPGLTSYGCLNCNKSPKYQFTLNPLFDADSPHILLDMYLNHVLTLPSIDPDEIGKLINNVNTVRYLGAVSAFQDRPTTYESMVQSSLLAQYEVRLVARLLLLIGSYYLGTHKNRPELGEPIEQAECKQLECYSNLCYYSIAIIALLSSSSDNIADFKDKLFENVLLHSNLRQELTKELCLSKSFEELRLFDGFGYTGDSLIPNLLTAHQSEVLCPLYTSSFQYNRYWVFQPMIEYYKYQVKGVNENNHRRDPNWFKNNIPWKIVTGDIVSSDDVAVITIILEFNLMLLFNSPTYNHLFVRPDIEEYLCILGCIFLDDVLFQHEPLAKALTKNIKLMMKDCLKGSGRSVKSPFKDATKIIANLGLPLADFFNMLVDQYESVSYGNKIFSNYIILFINPKSDKIFKKIIFQDKAETILRTLRLVYEEAYAPNDLFFGTKETDPEIIGLIKRAIPLTHPGSFLRQYCIFHSGP